MVAAALALDGTSPGLAHHHHPLVIHSLQAVQRALPVALLQAVLSVGHHLVAATVVALEAMAAVAVMVAVAMVVAVVTSEGTDDILGCVYFGTLMPTII